MRALLFFLATAFIFTGASAQSDNCATATLLSPSSSSVCTPVSGTSAGATQSMPGCAGTADDDVWYKFVAGVSSYSLTISPSVNYDAVLEVFSGSCGSLNSMECDDYDSQGGIESTHLTGLTPGQTYYFRVYEYSAGSGSNTFTVCLAESVAPSNDDCANATLITSASGTVCASPLSGTSYGGTDSGLSGCAGFQDDDVWYKFVATATSHSVTMVGSSGYDGVLEAFSGSCGSLTSIGCSDNSSMGGTEEIYLPNLTVGATYYYRIFDWHTGSGSSLFTTCVTTAPFSPPSNDDCSGAPVVPVNSICNAADTVVSSLGATLSMTGCAGNADDDIWFKFTAHNTREVINVTGDATADAVIELFSGTCGSLSSLQCRDYTGTSATESLDQSGLIVGQAYYFRIYDYYSGGKTFTVSVIDKEITASASGTLLCQGQQLTLANTGTATSYTWSSGVSNGSAFTPTASATYTLVGTVTGGCTDSDMVSVTVSTPSRPDICMVTVDTTNTNNVIYWEKNYANVDSFIVYREVLANVYNRIGAIDGQAFSRFVDTARHVGFRNGDPQVRSYKYKLQIRDTCDNYGPMSFYHTSLFMNNTGNVFTWNFYDIETLGSPVNNYEIYRDDNNTGSFNLVGTVSGSVNTYTDAAFSSFPNARWAVLGDGFSCNPSFKGANIGSILAVINKTKSNVKNNLPIADPPSDPDTTGTGVHELSSSVRVVLMPNPTSGSTDVITDAALQKVSVYNYLGELVLSLAANGQSSLHLDLQSLNSGLYNIELISRKGKTVRKLIVDH